MPTGMPKQPLGKQRYSYADHLQELIRRRHYDHKVYMLELINEARANAGAPPVALGDNIAAQLHAENALKGCFSGHWGLDGLKPYMRYSLAGGYQENSENCSGLSYCTKASDGYQAIQSIKDEIGKAMTGLMNSPGHRRNILDKWHRKVNIGLAWDEYNCQVVQHFEGGYVEYGRLPAITGGTLSFSGRGVNGLRFSEEKGLNAQVYYDPPPHSLTIGQVTRTYCYDSGLQIAALRYPLSGSYSWSGDEITKTYAPCPDPYDAPPDAPAPRSPDEAHEFWQQAYESSQARKERNITVPWITASEWRVKGAEFAVTADVSGLLSRHGAGVYTVLLWGDMGGESVPVSQYSIFHGVGPPATYGDGR